MKWHQLPRGLLNRRGTCKSMPKFLFMKHIFLQCSDFCCKWCTVYHQYSLNTILIFNNFNVDLFHKIICSLWNTIFNNVCTIKRPSFLQYDQWVGVKDTAVWCEGCGCLHQRPTGRGQQTSHSGPRTPSDISRAAITTNV